MKLKQRESLYSTSTVTLINYWWNCTERVWWRCYIGSDIWFQINLWEACCVSRADSKMLGILRKSSWMFYDRVHLERRLRCFVLSVLMYCFAVWCLAADSHHKLLDCIVSDANFLTWSVFECNIAHRRSVAVLWLLYKFRCSPMHPRSLWCSTCAERAIVGYKRCIGRTSVYTWASSMLHLAVPHYFNFLFSVSVERCGWPCIRSSQIFDF